MVSRTTARMIKAALHHLTRYTYSRRIALSPQIIRLRPAPHSRTAVPNYSLKISPPETFPQLAAGSSRQLAGAGRLPRSGRSLLAIEIDLLAELAVINPFDFFVDPTSAQHLPVPATSKRSPVT